MPKDTSMGKLQPDVEVTEITAKKAKEYLDGTFDRNRPIVRDAVNHYRSQMAAGKFLNATPIILAFIEDTDRLVLVDGQHRLAAVCQLKKPMTFTMMTYYLQNEKQLSDLYATIDVGRSRNLSDNVRAQGFQVESGLNQIEATRFVSSILWAERKKPAFAVKTTSAGSYADQIEKARSWMTEASEYFRIAKNTKGLMKNMSRRKPVVACALITFRGQPSKASQFWNGALMCDSIPLDDPRHRLHQKLLEVGATNLGARAQVITAYGLARIICTCWNAYITSRPLTVINPIRSLVFSRCKWREEK